MSGPKVEIQGLDKVLSLLDQLPIRVQKAILAELEEAARDIVNGAKRDAPANLGQLRNSITFQSIPKGFEVVVQSRHAPFMEFGTKRQTKIPAGMESFAARFKGPVGGTGDPMKAILDWVKKKGLSGRYSTKTRRRLGSKKSKEQEDKTAAFLIWRKIKKYGVKPRPFLYKQVAKVEPKLKARVADIIQQII